ncbi:MAG: hypothetical protein RL226_1690 [Bacteroidota bacterium]|jgi:chorismate synthase
MGGNTFGHLFRLTTFGESHGAAIGGVVDGCPAGVPLSATDIQQALDRRKPGQSELTTARKESDTVELLSGIFEGQTTGAPIGFIIRNADARSGDYDHLKDTFRPSHADYTWQQKFGIRDHRGGGRASARETACRVVGGAIASAFLRLHGVEIGAWVNRVHDIAMPENDRFYSRTETDAHLTRCPHPGTADQMQERILSMQRAGNTVGGSIRAVAQGLKPGIGEPVFHKLHADLGAAMLSINAVKAFEIGSGIHGTFRTGEEENDLFVAHADGIGTSSNRSGGIQGGISNGQPVVCTVHFKPVATLMKSQASVSSDGAAVTIEGKGRHDACVLPRAVPIVESMMALVIADHLLLARANRAL